MEAKKTALEIAEKKPEVKRLMEESSKMITELMQILQVNELNLTAKYTDEVTIKVTWTVKKAKN
jgi:hypothetical protein